MSRENSLPQFSSADLFKLGACDGDMHIFINLFGSNNPVPATQDNIKRAIDAGTSIDWLLKRYLEPDLYEYWHVQALMLRNMHEAIAPGMRTAFSISAAHAYLAETMFYLQYCRRHQAPNAELRTVREQRNKYQEQLTEAQRQNDGHLHTITSLQNTNKGLQEQVEDLRKKLHAAREQVYIEAVHDLSNPKCLELRSMDAAWRTAFIVETKRGVPWEYMTADRTEWRTGEGLPGLVGGAVYRIMCTTPGTVVEQDKEAACRKCRCDYLRMQDTAYQDRLRDVKDAFSKTLDEQQSKCKQLEKDYLALQAKTPTHGDCPCNTVCRQMVEKCGDNSALRVQLAYTHRELSEVKERLDSIVLRCGARTCYSS